MLHILLQLFLRILAVLLLPPCPYLAYSIRYVTQLREPRTASMAVC